MRYRCRIVKEIHMKNSELSLWVDLNAFELCKQLPSSPTAGCRWQLRVSTASTGHPRCTWQSGSHVGGERCQWHLCHEPMGAEKCRSIHILTPPNPPQTSSFPNCTCWKMSAQQWDGKIVCRGPLAVFLTDNCWVRAEGLTVSVFSSLPVV